MLRMSLLRSFLAPSNPLRGISSLLGSHFCEVAEREGFEPPVPFGTMVFKTTAIDHSAISPIVDAQSDTGAILHVNIAFR